MTATKYVNSNILAYYDTRIKNYIAQKNIIPTVVDYATLIAKTADDVIDGQRFFVLDARADSSVTGGTNEQTTKNWAIYIARVTETEQVVPESDPEETEIVKSLSWTKIAEGESLDVLVSWGDIQNKPTIGNGSSFDIAAGSHTHGNISNTGALTHEVTDDQTNETSIVAVASGTPLITGTNGVIQEGVFATGANAESSTAFVAGNDVRLTNGRAMTGYAALSSAPQSEAIGTSDTLNGAIAKLEYRLDNAATALSNIEDMTEQEVDALFDEEEEEEQGGAGQGE